MREIKFRGKHIHAFINPSNTGIWVYGYLCNDHYINSEELMGEMLVDKDTIGQYTGLKDKNGKEIYEGDIIHILGGHFEQGFYEWNEKVIIKDLIHDGFELMMTISQIGNESITVIGNIYENPELLK